MPLRVEKLSKQFGETWALRDVSFETAEGEIFGVFGGTGSGKTTLMRCIAGREKVSGGSVLINGTDVSSSSEKKRGLYFADPGKEAGLSSLLGRSRIGRSASDGRIREFEVSVRSGEPNLLYDEPFTGIDPFRRDKMLGTLQGLAENGRTILFASSDFEQIAAVCSRLAVIENGEVLQIGTPQDVYERPDSVAVASAVGQNNLAAARRLTSTNADMPEFITIDGNHRLFVQHVEKSRLGAINQNVTLAIRPEQLSISFGASFPEDNLLKAVVTGIRFLGATTMVGLDADGLKLQARVFRVVGLDVGDECMIAIPPDRIQVLKG